MRRLRSEVLAERAGAEEAARRPAVDPLAVHKRESVLHPPGAGGPRLHLGMTAGTEAEKGVAALLVARAAPASWLYTLIPHGGPGNVIVDRTRYLQQTNLHQITLLEGGDVFFTSAVEQHRKTFDRVIVWVPVTEAEREREYLLRAFELTGSAGGKLVAVVSIDLAEERGFRVWANQRKAVFDAPGSACLREQGLALMTIWKG